VVVAWWWNVVVVECGVAWWSVALTRAIADEIWKIYHSDTQRAAMYDEVEKSCFNEPNQ
jgi:hypothetical protein